jgi:hypothetical protein
MPGIGRVHRAVQLRNARTRCRGADRQKKDKSQLTVELGTNFARTFVSRPSAMLELKRWLLGAHFKFILQHPIVSKKA